MAAILSVRICSSPLVTSFNAGPELLANTTWGRKRGTDPDLIQQKAHQRGCRKPDLCSPQEKLSDERHDSEDDVHAAVIYKKQGALVRRTLKEKTRRRRDRQHTLPSLLTNFLLKVANTTPVRRQLAKTGILDVLNISLEELEKPALQREPTFSLWSHCSYVSTSQGRSAGKNQSQGGDRQRKQPQA